MHFNNYSSNWKYATKRIISLCSMAVNHETTEHRIIKHELHLLKNMCLIHTLYSRNCEVHYTPPNKLSLKLFYFVLFYKKGSIWLNCCCSKMKYNSTYKVESKSNAQSTIKIFLLVQLIMDLCVHILLLYLHEHINFHLSVLCSSKEIE